MKKQLTDGQIKIRKIVKTLRGAGIKDEQMALELGVVIDTLRRWLSGASNPSRASNRKILKLEKRYKKVLQANSE